MYPAFPGNLSRQVGRIAVKEGSSAGEIQDAPTPGRRAFNHRARVGEVGRRSRVASLSWLPILPSGLTSSLVTLIIGNFFAHPGTFFQNRKNSRKYRSWRSRRVDGSAKA